MRFTAAILLLCAASAHAKPGDHIRAGDTTLVPEVDVGMEYRTNTYRAANDPVAGTNLRVSPSLELGVDTEENAFELSGEWEVRKFLFLDVENPDNRAQQIQAADRFNDFNIGANLSALRNQKVGLEVSERVTLRNNQTDRGVLGSPFVTQVRNSLLGGLRLSPGPALDVVPGGEWSYDDYRIPGEESSRIRFNSRHTYVARLNATWQFFPRTDFVFDASSAFYAWDQATVDVLDPFTGLAGEVATPNSTHVRALTGVEGRFTERLFVDLLFGYGTALYATDSAGVIAEVAADLRGVNGLIGSVQTRYKVSREDKRAVEVSAGYKRDFDDSFFTNYVAYDNLFGQAAFDFGGLRPKVAYGVRFEDYSGAVVRDDVLSRFDTELGYQFRNWGRVTAGMNWQQRGVVQTAYQSAEYDDFTFRLNSTWTY